jgi:hypothetical protein
MKKNGEEGENLDEKITKKSSENELEKKNKLLTLIAKIIVKATLKEYYETCD